MSSTYQCCSTRMQDHFLRVSQSTDFISRPFKITTAEISPVFPIVRPVTSNLSHHTFITYRKYFYTSGGTKISLFTTLKKVKRMMVKTAAKWLKKLPSAWHRKLKRGQERSGQSLTTRELQDQTDPIWQVLATFSYLSRIKDTVLIRLWSWSWLGLASLDYNTGKYSALLQQPGWLITSARFQFVFNWEYLRYNGCLCCCCLNGHQLVSKMSPELTGMLSVILLAILF